MNQISSQKILYFQKPIPLIPFAEALIGLTPKVSLVGNDIYADISPTEHLFGGEIKLLEKLETLLDLFKITSPWILTEKINWAKALCLKRKQILKKGESHPLLLSLPVEHLALCGNPLDLENQMSERKELVTFLRKMGVVFCGDFLKLPSNSLAIRFGKLGSSLLNTLHGTNEPFLPYFTPQEPLFFTVDADDLFSIDSLFYEIEQALPVIEARLLGRGTLAKEIKISFHLENKQIETETLSLSQLTRSPSIIRRVLWESISKKHLKAPVARFLFEITDAIQTSPGQLNLLDNSEERFQDLMGFINRMKIQFGEDQVGFAQILPHHLPEQSWKFVFYPSTQPCFYPERSRPLFLFSKPTPFSPSPPWKLTELERLSLNWWDSPISRHYFCAEHPQGEKLWVFFDPHTRKWFCHGSYD